MALFTRLLGLYGAAVPTEDFFTEIVAHLLESNDDLLFRWVKALNLPLPDTKSYTHTAVSTQKKFQALSHHEQNSRPDMLIELIDGEYRDWILIESKLGASEGNKQLKRYAELLHTAPNIRHKILLYITRDYDPKDAAKILAEVPPGEVYFQQSRWHHFYHILTDNTDSHLVQETLKFMETKKMATSNQFRPEDLIALPNLGHVLKMMQETLADEVKEEYLKQVGSSINDHQMIREIQSENRYIRHRWLKNTQWWFGFGYFLNAPYPNLGLTIVVSPQSPQRPAIIEAMQSICLRQGWSPYGLNDASTWSSISYMQSLSYFLDGEDHIAAIKVFFLQALAEFANVKEQYAHLPWNDSKLTEQ